MGSSIRRFTGLTTCSDLPPWFSLLPSTWLRLENTFSWPRSTTMSRPSPLPSSTLLTPRTCLLPSRLRSSSHCSRSACQLCRVFLCRLPLPCPPLLLRLWSLSLCLQLWSLSLCPPLWSLHLRHALHLPRPCCPR